MIRAFVLLAIADDYEDLTMIFRWVGKLAEPWGMTISAEEILHALASGIESDLLKTYLIGNGDREIRLLPAPIQYGDDWVYFYITPKGTAALSDIPSEWFPV